MVRIPGNHVPNIKNRSSKQNIWFTKMKPVVKSMSNEELMRLNTTEASNEMKRRSKKNKKGE